MPNILGTDQICERPSFCRISIGKHQANIKIIFTLRILYIIRKKYVLYVTLSLSLFGDGFAVSSDISVSRVRGFFFLIYF